MKKILVIAALCAVCAGAHAVPAFPGVISRVQPDGDTLHVYLRGDERSHFTMTEDGWQVMEDEKGWLKYAKKNRKGKVVVSWRKAHDAGKRKKCEIKWINKYGIKKN